MRQASEVSASFEIKIPIYNYRTDLVLKQAVILDFPPETTEDGLKSYYGSYKKKPINRQKNDLNGQK